MKISIIAAIGKNNELGRDNKLLWHISEDLKRFREKTKNHVVIMGRKTWESLPVKPLPNRYNIVITQNTKYKIPDTKKATIVKSLKEAIAIGKKKGKDELFVIGGGQIFEQALPLADKLYLTIIDKTFDADTFFPDYTEFKKKKVVGEGESEGHNYTFLELER